MVKIKKLDELINLRKRWKQEGKKVVFTNGCFDILHLGHIKLFKFAKGLGDILIVGVNSDSSIKKIKGSKRPIFPLNERLEVLEAIEYIDYLTVFEEETPLKLITSLLPDILVKGGDWKPEQVVGGKEVEEAGGKVVIFPYVRGHSSSNIIEKIKTLF
ncbi:D-glycero-beta-D-manno-heptose 1-phosphate adenylyltransferase [Candidatus Aminicenantes bacterium AC-335-A11]|jgi:D-beta-D-heptose 7-phosphate kinase/D-beta-D-heptose 1-phosphate adenosyltransferase|nr:D-glycero-beta-D-manno-heptose 1-phosphate adenylyltransferase [SCandidatus Aminicenantes bacterium Aminicenantia_JdfR_composite]MCP2596430.1 D-glycero-beta-D-manno-heptose 1-phosphate adenylyltransferase [Candidatus Aminicenantes bacterium AC-335-G13]MCP2618192.1 D-glycero-beta-D-manno-heptose 1-phosphate adenylyltransferase [Candidatus Aminicenantes bacterium AC-335-A11]MCP2621133.1 D-glycero-beta-D-manno-heptose 1-phosphate adenylyltransferase [Candidatus Aminicenantes bacterium AC-334-E05